MKVFISQPFYGRSEREIMNERAEILQQFKDRTGATDVEVIETYYKPYAPEGAGRLWYLGDSIKLMDRADAVIFSPYAFTANGCGIEYAAARTYGKKIFFAD